MQTVILINDHSEPLEIHSFKGLTNEFYASALQDLVLAPFGGNTTINVYYLPTTIGLKKSPVTIKTNRGEFSYNVNHEIFIFYFLIQSNLFVLFSDQWNWYIESVSFTTIAQYRNSIKFCL